MVTGLLDVLDPRARFAVEQRFGLNDGRSRSYREVGEELGVTAEAARRLVKRAVSTVREEAGTARRSLTRLRLTRSDLAGHRLHGVAGGRSAQPSAGCARLPLSLPTPQRARLADRDAPGPRAPGGSAPAEQQPDWPDAGAARRRAEGARVAIPRWCSPARPGRSPPSSPRWPPGRRSCSRPATAPSPSTRSRPTPSATSSRSSSRWPWCSPTPPGCRR